MKKIEEEKARDARISTRQSERQELIQQNRNALEKIQADLRERDLSLGSIVYTTDSFFTKAFGGIYLLRNFITPILIFEDTCQFLLMFQRFQCHSSKEESYRIYFLHLNLKYWQLLHFLCHEVDKLSQHFQKYLKQ